jgi:nucleotide-binding universal stress UspA family protein
MGEIKKILVALAFSDYSAEEFAYASDLAAVLDADLVAANIVNERDVAAVNSIVAMGYDLNTEDYVKGLIEERQARLEEMVKTAKFPKDRLTIVFNVGNPVDELLKIILVEKVDLVVMGIKGRTDLEYMLVGSVAEKLFRRSPVPIISYRDKKNAERLRSRIHL